MIVYKIYVCLSMISLLNDYMIDCNSVWYITYVTKR